MGNTLPQLWRRSRTRRLPRSCTNFPRGSQSRSLPRTQIQQTRRQRHKRHGVQERSTRKVEVSKLRFSRRRHRSTSSMPNLSASKKLLRGLGRKLLKQNPLFLFSTRRNRFIPEKQFRITILNCREGFRVIIHDV